MKSRNFALILYPEDKIHVEALETIKNQFSYAYILHDKDKYEKDEINEKTGEIEHKKGELKKEHWHIMITLKNARTINSISEILDIQKNYIQKCNFYEMTRYLIHLGYPKKYQYKKEEIITNMQERIEYAIKRDYNAEEEKSMILLEEIKRKEGHITFWQLTQFAIEKDCLTELQKKSFFFKNLCDDIGFRRY